MQELFAFKWINEDIQDKIWDSHWEGLIIHKFYKAMGILQRLIRVIFLDFRKAFYLIDRNILLKNI